MNKGFTLVELLIAIVILSLISVMAFRGLASVIETRSRLGMESRKWHDLALFFSRFGNDLSRPAHRPVTDESGNIQPEFSGKPGYSAPNDADILFTRMGYDEEGSQRIGYRINGGKIEELVWTHLDQAPGAAPKVYTLLDDVSAFQLRYLAMNDTWGAFWPLPQQPQPKAVEVTVVLNSGEKIVRIFSLI